MLTIALAVLGDPQALTNACELMLKSDKPAWYACVPRQHCDGWRRRKRWNH